MAAASSIACCLLLHHSTGEEVEVLLDAINGPNGPPPQLAVRPLTGTRPGCIFAEPATHRRPFPKRKAIPFDRWRNSGAFHLNRDDTTFLPYLFSG
jgi:hypothetical protein